MHLTARLGPLGTLSLVLSLIFLITACSNGRLPGQGSDNNADASGQSDLDTRAAEALAELQNEIDYPLYAPYELHDLSPGAQHVTGPDKSPIVVLRLERSDESTQMLQFQQSMSSPGIVVPPPDLQEERQIRVQGDEATLQIGSRDDEPMVLLNWEMDGIHFVIAATAVTVEDVERIAESVRPIDGERATVGEADDSPIVGDDETGETPDADTRAEEALRELLGEVDFPIYAPHYLHELQIQAYGIAGPERTPIVLFTLYEPDSPASQLVELHQSAENAHVPRPSAPDDVADERQIQVLGKEARLYIWQGSDGQRVLLDWTMEGTHLSLMASQVDEDAVLRIAESLSEVQ